MRFLQAGRLYFNHDVFSCAMVLLIMFLQKIRINFIYVYYTYAYVTEFTSLSKRNCNVGISNVVKIMYHQRQEKENYVIYQNITVGLRWIYLMCWISCGALERSNNPLWNLLLPRIRKGSSLCGFDWKENPEKGLGKWKKVSLTCNWNLCV